jgi:uncharacterized membrane protein YraQ (UPF0718 family)
MLGTGLCDRWLHERHDSQRSDHTLSGTESVKVDKLPGGSSGGIYPCCMLVHDPAALRRDLEARRWFGGGDHLSLRRSGGKHPGDRLHRRICIGMAMAWLFRGEEAKRAVEMADNGLFESEARVTPAVWAVFALLIAVLIVGTLKVDLLADTYFKLHLPLEFPTSLTVALDQVGLDLQGALLILMLILLAPVAYLGLENVLERFNRWTYLSMAFVAMTLLLAAPAVDQGSLTVGITGRFIGEVILVVAIGAIAQRGFARREIGIWLWETWKFVKQIFPLLIVGVFAAGMVRAILPEQWVQTLAGKNTVWANLVGVLFGVFMYFPTLVEVPIARMFLDLGMHRGPLLAYLLADPELSIQSILVTGKILGRRKTLAYVVLVTTFSTLAGFLFGLFMAVL